MVIAPPSMSSMTRNPAAQFWQVVRTDSPPSLDQNPRPGVLPLTELNDRLNLFFADVHAGETAQLHLRAAALLYHDHHDAAHDIVQEMTDAVGCLIHAMVHRREPDFWNAKYWFRRVVDHPVYRRLTPQLPQLVTHADARREVHRLTLSGTLDPIAFVDACEAAGGDPENSVRKDFLRRVQHAEFEALVAHLLA
jgi:hypothetical protein